MLQYIIQIDFVNSPGLGYEIFRITEKNNVDKIAMEVIPEQGMIIQFQCAKEEQAQSLVADLTELENITAVTFRTQMPYQEKEIELRTILNSVSEGVLAINKKGIVSHINEVACTILGCKLEEAIGLPVEELVGESPPILETLHFGDAHRLKERRIKRNGRTVQFLSSNIPIRNSRGRIIGAVSTIQDFRQVEKVILQANKSSRLITFDDIIHQSQQMARLIASARAVSRISSTVLLRGESGTGKELFANAIHTEGSRRNRPFIPINCAALTESLLESELFGYEEGAFTGAVKGGKKGLFEQANGGTLFLDEIGDISPRLQVRLLRVLQEGTVRRVGGDKDIRVDVRVIAATHRNLEEMIQSGNFRDDLYYRLNVIPLTIPPLRERKADIPLLSQHLIRKICAEINKPEAHLAQKSLELLVAQEWPGNVRQLENTLERVINLIDNAEIRPEHLAAWTDITEAVTLRSTGPISKNHQTLQVEIPIAGDWPPLKEIVASVEKEIITRVLKKHPSSRLAGQVLGVSNTTILNKIKEYKI
ncbi:MULTISPECIES: sigma-54-dependent Fis family transcriptional regulator [Sporomusa]|uniref:sigma-54 interaction domain-containing protein n=1 Tax=Sporomusa TaxID=2375 RepID=UPI00166882B3|nr:MULTISPECIES: sigma 54-interacting transcriptional regulator [Sporomusa]HML34498.1 sigma 54-interacting transcriptional regulator [Sporomusa sphaeroides]